MSDVREGKREKGNSNGFLHLWAYQPILETTTTAWHIIVLKEMVVINFKASFEHKISFFKSCWPGTPCDLPASVSHMLGFQVSTTILRQRHLCKFLILLMVLCLTLSKTWNFWKKIYKAVPLVKALAMPAWEPNLNWILEPTEKHLVLRCGGGVDRMGRKFEYAIQPQK